MNFFLVLKHCLHSYCKMCDVMPTRTHREASFSTQQIDSDPLTTGWGKVFHQQVSFLILCHKDEAGSCDKCNLASRTLIKMQPPRNLTSFSTHQPKYNPIRQVQFDVHIYTHAHTGLYTCRILFVTMYACYRGTWVLRVCHAVTVFNHKQSSSALGSVQCERSR